MAEGDAENIGCCGSERRSRYCPDCGKQLRDTNTLYGLADYVREHYEKKCKLLAEYEKRFPNAQDDSIGRRKQLRIESDILKWSSWLSELNALMAELLEEPKESNGKTKGPQPCQPLHPVPLAPPEKT